MEQKGKLTFDMVQIGIHAKYHELPAWVRNSINLGGSGFNIRCPKMDVVMDGSWYDYVVKDWCGNIFVWKQIYVNRLKDSGYFAFVDDKVEPGEPAVIPPLEPILSESDLINSAFNLMMGVDTLQYLRARDDLFSDDGQGRYHAEQIERRLGELLDATEKCRVTTAQCVVKRIDHYCGLMLNYVNDERLPKISYMLLIAQSLKSVAGRGDNIDKFIDKYPTV